MKVDVMRWVDKWAGIPLTFLLSIFLLIYEKILFANRTKPDIRRTLFIELSEMGSAILADPAMRKLREMGHGELYFAIFVNNYKSLKILGTIPESHIYLIRSGNFFKLIVDVIGYMRWCRRKRITAVIDLELFSRFTALLSGISGARTRIGFSAFHDEGNYRGKILNFPVRYNPHVHISVNFMSLVNRALDYFDTPYSTISIPPDEISLEKANIDPEMLARVRNKLKSLYPAFGNEKIVLLNVNASDLLPQRRWLQENFVSVGKKIVSAYENILVVATGTHEERLYVEQVVKRIGNDRCVNSAGVFEFEELVPLFSASIALLTNDSGPAHFASVTTIKIFVIFGPETPALYGPLGDAESIYLGLPCSPCVSAANHRKTTCLPRPCITGISADSVAVRIMNYLDRIMA